ncbi:hypothetical protein [Pantoea eucrina]|uniref:hypothetical protein n=1 Tax=Pantoea eucrina TaxID=472693 RepID=UPI000A245AB8|nr:hypothetical protein [Pantoea eucrina]ORM78307.1 hypothetical protein HA43_08155 [Pantoea eucrina]
MTVYTLTVEFPEGLSPAVGPKTDILGGKPIRVAYFDTRDDHLSSEQVELIERALEYYCDQHSEDDLDIPQKLQFLTQE